MTIPQRFCSIAFAAFLVSAKAAPNNLTADLKSLTNASPAKVRAYFDSDWYKSLHRSDSEFLTDLYRGILGREPDAPGFAIWQKSLANSNDPSERAKAVEAFLKAPEYVGKHDAPKESLPKKDTTRLPGNVLFDTTGVFVNDATALPADRFAPL